MRFRLTEEIWKEGDMYVSYCPELDISSCAETIEQAKINLYDSIQITVEEAKKMGTFESLLNESGLEVENNEIYSVRKSLIGFTPIEIAF